MLTVEIEYYAQLREERGIDREMLSTSARTARDLYLELKDNHGFSPEMDRLWVAVNDAITSWEQDLNDGDKVVFIPPVAGG
jgi:molybdopterin converting factor small subunit